MLSASFLFLPDFLDRSGIFEVCDDVFTPSFFQSLKLPSECILSTLSAALFEVSQDFLLLPVKFAVGDMAVGDIDFALDEVGDEFISPLCGVLVNDGIVLIDRTGVDQGELPCLLLRPSPERILQAVGF